MRVARLDPHQVNSNELNDIPNQLFPQSDDFIMLDSLFSEGTLTDSDLIECDIFFSFEDCIPLKSTQDSNNEDEIPIEVNVKSIPNKKTRIYNEKANIAAYREKIGCTHFDFFEHEAGKFLKFYFPKKLPSKSVLFEMTSKVDRNWDSNHESALLWRKVENPLKISRRYASRDGAVLYFYIARIWDTSDDFRTMLKQEIMELASKKKV